MRKFEFLERKLRKEIGSGNWYGFYPAITKPHRLADGFIIKPGMIALKVGVFKIYVNPVVQGDDIECFIRINGAFPKYYLPFFGVMEHILSPEWAEAIYNWIVADPYDDEEAFDELKALGIMGYR